MKLVPDLIGAGEKTDTAYFSSSQFFMLDIMFTFSYYDNAHELTDSYFFAKNIEYLGELFSLCGEVEIEKTTKAIILLSLLLLSYVLQYVVNFPKTFPKF